MPARTTCLQHTTPSSPNLKAEMPKKKKRTFRAQILRALRQLSPRKDERGIRVATIHEHGHIVLDIEFIASHGHFESLAHYQGLSKFARVKMLATSKVLFDLCRDCHNSPNRRFAHSRPQNFGPQVTGT
ncbi:hypothetical protein BDR05DRAFT_967036 [Suillus weaverae]|nr:hypothetical protein BDR05DRAFT_967036 [Suillus weaverae]